MKAQVVTVNHPQMLQPLGHAQGAGVSPGRDGRWVSPNTLEIGEVAKTFREDRQASAALNLQPPEDCKIAQALREGRQAIAEADVKVLERSVRPANTFRKGLQKLAVEDSQSLQSWEVEHAFREGGQELAANVQTLKGCEIAESFREGSQALAADRRDSEEM